MGKLPFDYQDSQSELITFDSVLDHADPLSAFTREKEIFGSLAREPRRLKDLDQAVKHADFGLKTTDQKI